MTLFKSKLMDWWEMGLVKFSVICIGIAIGANWHDVFMKFTLTLIGLGLVAGLYSLYLWLKK